MKRLRILLWALAALALVGAGALLLLRGPAEQPAQGIVTLGGPFTLTGVDGRAFSSSQLAGRPYAIFFGFTHCPDVCPTTLARMVRLRRQLGAAGAPLQVVFVTVDPERDGPAELKAYLALFEDPVIGLTGTPSQVAQAKRQFGIYSEKVPDQAGGYTVDHTATVLLFDRHGKFTATIAQGEGDQVALDKLAALVKA